MIAGETQSDQSKNDKAEDQLLAAADPIPLRREGTLHSCRRRLDCCMESGGIGATQDGRNIVMELQVCSSPPEIDDPFSSF